MSKQKDWYKRWTKLEKIRMQRDRAIKKCIRRAFILGSFGLSDPKDLPEECKHCNNFYCTFCFKCKFLTKKDNDPDFQARTEEKTKNFIDYENLCTAIFREYL